MYRKRKWRRELRRHKETESKSGGTDNGRETGQKGSATFCGALFHAYGCQKEICRFTARIPHGEQGFVRAVC